MVKTYARPPLMLVRGEGCYVWDVENRKYLDFTAGIAVNALGHCDPEISKLIAQQVCVSSSFFSSNYSYILRRRKR
jgi:acetylornithine aminotransferase